MRLIPSSLPPLLVFHRWNELLPFSLPLTLDGLADKIEEVGAGERDRNWPIPFAASLIVFLTPFSLRAVVLASLSSVYFSPARVEQKRKESREGLELVDSLSMH